MNYIIKAVLIKVPNFVRLVRTQTGVCSLSVYFSIQIIIYLETPMRTKYCFRQLFFRYCTDTHTATYQNNCPETNDVFVPVRPKHKWTSLDAINIVYLMELAGHSEDMPKTHFENYLIYHE